MTTTHLNREFGPDEELHDEPPFDLDVENGTVTVTFILGDPQRPHDGGENTIAAVEDLADQLIKIGWLDQAAEILGALEQHERREAGRCSGLPAPAVPATADDEHIARYNLER